MTAYERVMAARDSKKLTAVDYISHMFGDSFFELHGDRRYEDDKAIVAGLAMLYDTPITVIGIEKGRNIKERVERNFGQAHPEGYRKALRLMKQAEKFRRPVLCLVDTSGAFCGIGAEERGQGQAIAENLMEMMTLRTPIISVLIGEGGSGGALALAVANKVWMMENAIYSVISPEGCASILWKDAKRAEEAADVLKLTAQDSLENDIIDEVISEENLGTEAFYYSLRDKIEAELRELSSLTMDELLEQRYQHFRKIGRPMA